MSNISAIAWSEVGEYINECKTIIKKNKYKKESREENGRKKSNKE